MEFSTILKELRDANGVTQDDLAEMLKVSRPTIAGYETRNRQPDYDKLIAIANLFHVSIDYLLTGKSASSDSKDNELQLSEHVVDKAVIQIYESLTLENKQSVLDYVRLLELKQQQTSIKEK